MQEGVRHSKHFREETKQAPLRYFPLYMELKHVYGIFPKIKLKGIQDTFCVTAKWNTETEDLLSLRNRVSWEFEFLEGDILTTDKDDETIWKYEQRGPFKNKRFRKADGTMGTKRTPYLYLGSKAKNAETTMMVDENVNTKAKITKVYNKLQRQFRAKKKLT